MENDREAEDIPHGAQDSRISQKLIDKCISDGTEESQRQREQADATYIKVVQNMYQRTSAGVKTASRTTNNFSVRDVDDLWGHVSKPQASSCLQMGQSVRWTDT